MDLLQEQPQFYVGFLRAPPPPLLKVREANRLRHGVHAVGFLRRGRQRDENAHVLQRQIRTGNGMVFVFLA